MPTDLIVLKVDKARALLAQARDACDAKKVADLAKSAEVYAKRQKLSEEVIGYATTVRMDAMTLMGEFLKRAPKNGPQHSRGGGSKGSQREPLPDAPPTLADIGISKKESSEAQALASLKEKAPKLHEQVKSGQLTVAQARREVQDDKKRKDLEVKAAAAAAAVNGDGEEAEQPWIIHQGDCLAIMQSVEGGQARLAFADPPYNIGVDYGAGQDSDKLPRPQYLDWCRSWMAGAARALTADGSFWVLINDESAAEFKALLEAVGLHLRQWLIWYESFGVNCSGQFNRTHRHLLWYVKDPRHFVWNEAPEIKRPSDREAKYADKRAQPGGKIWDSVWGINPPIPRLTGTCAERIPSFPTQLPLALLTPIVACASDPGDTVIDLFAGSASMGEACLRLGRQFAGFELSEKFASLGRKRLQAVSHDLSKRACDG